MSILAARPTVRTSARRPRIAAPTLTLVIGGIPYAVRLNVDDRDDNITVELCGPDGRPFAVSNDLIRRDGDLVAHHCGRCDARGDDGCIHIEAAIAVGVFG